MADYQQQPYMSDDEVNELAEKLKDPSSQAMIKQMGKVANDPKFSATVPADTQQSLKQALADAKSAYQARVNQNEWLDVAQTLGRAVAQFGGAVAGQRGGNKADMSQLNMGQPLDYNSRSDRAFREYQSDIGQAKEMSDLERRKAEDEENRRKFELGRQQNFLGGGLKAALDTERLKSGEENANKRIQYQENAANARMEQQDKRAAEREAAATKRMDLGDVSKQEQSLQQRLEAARSLANEALSDNDLRSKSKEDLAKRYGPLAAKAGIDPNDLASIGEQSKGSGFLGTGLFRSEDKEKKSQLINEQVIAPIKNMLDAVRARKQELIRGGKVQQPAAQTEEAPAPAPEEKKAPGRDPKIDKYAADNKLDYNKAKDILIGRGYKPAE